MDIEKVVRDLIIVDRLAPAQSTLMALCTEIEDKAEGFALFTKLFDTGLELLKALKVDEKLIPEPKEEGLKELWHTLGRKYEKPQA